MKNRVVLSGLLFLIISGQLSLLKCQSTDVELKKVSVDKAQQSLSGNLNYDSKVAFDYSSALIPDNSKNYDERKKSVWLAAGLSAVVPGAGEFYSGSYIKSAVFIAIEAAAITAGLIYNKKGDNQTDFFQNYADQHWSVNRYAQWTIYHIPNLNPNLQKTANDYPLLRDNNQTDLRAYYAQLNQLERDVAGNGDNVVGMYYSHQLPFHGEQQYYELIGKYPQFNVGWDDFGNDVTKAYSYGDPLTPHFIYYSDERGKANDYYNVAAKAVLIVVINHIVSALDAAWSAHNYNKGLEMKVSLERFDYGFQTVYYPQLNMKYNF